MVVRKILIAVIVVIVLVAVVLGAAYVVLTQTPPGPPGAAPTVTSTSPASAATGVPITTKIIVTFSKAMDPSTITASTFTLKRGTTSVAGTVTYTGVTATFESRSNLATGVSNISVLMTRREALEGNALAAN